MSDFLSGVNEMTLQSEGSDKVVNGSSKITNSVDIEGYTKCCSQIIGKTEVTLYTKDNCLKLIGVRNGNALFEIKWPKYPNSGDKTYSFINIGSGSTEDRDFISIAVLENDRSKNMPYSIQIAYIVSDDSAERVDFGNWSNRESGTVYKFNKGKGEFDRNYY